jgi:uncharacterized protein YggT (Ycf19 family)
MHLTVYVGYVYVIYYYIYLYIINLINAWKMEHITKIYYFIDILHSTYISVFQTKILEQDKILNTQPRNKSFGYFTTAFMLRGLVV